MKLATSSVKIEGANFEVLANSQAMTDKPIEWVGAAKRDLMDFSDDARRQAGFELRTIQQGDLPSDFKPMSIIGKGVEEIRIRTDDAYRIFYVARFEEAVYVLHVFQKKTQKTSSGDIDLGQQRYKQMLQQRQDDSE
jgi:phage-related protein